MEQSRRPKRAARAGHVLRAFTFYYTVGWILHWCLVRYEKSGRLTVSGHEQYFAALRRGKVLIVANHPGVIESLFIATLGHTHFWCEVSELLPFSFPDPASFLPRWLWWVGPFIRCVPVHRASTHKKTASLRSALQLLSSGEVLVLHPEGGRTRKGTSFVEHPSGRRMRADQSTGAAFLAVQPDVLVLPVWVSFHGGLPQPHETYRDLWRRGLHIAVGTPFAIDRSRKQSREKIQQQITEAILSTGLEIAP
jgi:1-acyl-sn-glycerol-3-phosphate acyltransferase